MAVRYPTTRRWQHCGWPLPPFQDGRASHPTCVDHARRSHHDYDKAEAEEKNPETIVQKIFDELPVP